MMTVEIPKKKINILLRAIRTEDELENPNWKRLIKFSIGIYHSYFSYEKFNEYSKIFTNENREYGLSVS